MEALLDNDIVYKIARLGLVTEFDELLVQNGYQRPYGRLPTVIAVLRTGKISPPSDRWPFPAQQKALHGFLTANCKAISPGNTPLIAQLSKVRKIDPGEVLLFAQAIESPNAVVLTGDKNALRALSSEPALSGVATALTARVVSFEMVLIALLRRVGAPAIRRASARYGSVDKSLEFACSGSTSDSGLLAQLKAYAARLRGETGALLRRDLD